MGPDFQPGSTILVAGDQGKVESCARGCPSRLSSRDKAGIPPARVSEYEWATAPSHHAQPVPSVELRASFCALLRRLWAKAIWLPL